MLNKGDISGNQELLLTGDIRWRNPTKNRRFWQSILVAKKLWNLSTGARQTRSLRVGADCLALTRAKKELLSDYFSSGLTSSAPRRSKRRSQRVRRSVVLSIATRAGWKPALQKVSWPARGQADRKAGASLPRAVSGRRIFRRTQLAP